MIKSAVHTGQISRVVAVLAQYYSLTSAAFNKLATYSLNELDCIVSLILSLVVL